MNIKDEYLDALKGLGYTETEARFLYIVATRSGYFTAQQYLDFAAVRRGYRSDALARKLLSKKHASTEIYRKNARVYHLFSRRVYSAIGRENIRNRRNHEFQFIKTRLLVLDFILANQRHHYFELKPNGTRSKVPPFSIFGVPTLYTTYYLDPVFAGGLSSCGPQGRTSYKACHCVACSANRTRQIMHSDFFSFFLLLFPRCMFPSK